MKKYTLAAIIFSILCFGVILNTDAQNEWEFIDTGYDFILYDISFPEGQSEIGYAVGSSSTYNGDGIILKTTDGGFSWEQISVGTIPGLEAVYFTDLNTGYAGGWQNYFVKTIDGGETWTEITINAGIWFFIDIEFWDENNGIAVGFATDVYVTSDAGETWTAATGVSAGIQDLTYATSDLVFAVGGDEKIMKSTNGGLSWSEIYSGMFQFLFFGVDFYDENYGVVGGEDGKVLITSDGGTSWSTSNASGFALWHGVFCFNEDSTYLSGTPEHVYKTVNGGTIWVDDYPNSNYNVAFYKVLFTPDNNTGFICGSQGTIMRKEGIEPAPSATVDPDEIFYTQTWVGETSSFPIEISNTGNAILNILNISSDNPVFYSDITSFDLEAGESQDVNVIFEPDDGGNFTGTLSIESNDPQNPVLEVSMQGEGILPQAVISVDSELNFDTTLVWETSQEILTVWNIGNIDLEVSDIILSNPVFEVNLTSFTIEPGQSEDVTVSFSPDEEMTYEESLQIISNDLGNPTMVNLEGVGILGTFIKDINGYNNLSAHPNPFTDNITIVCDSRIQPESQLVIYNLHGQEVKRLVAQKNSKQFTWDGSGKEGDKVPAGIYFGVIELNNSKEQIKMIKW